MTQVFTPIGNSIILGYADDSTDTSLEIPNASAFLVVNPEKDDVIVFNAGFTDADLDAVVPTSGSNGHGVVIGPLQSLVVALPGAQYTAGPVFISVAGTKTSGNVYITPGTV